MLIYHNTAEHRFLAELDGEHAGQIIYEVDGDGSLRVVSTQVRPEFEGRGIAGQLLDALVCYAEQSGVKVVPVCSYVVSAFTKMPQKYQAVR